MLIQLGLQPSLDAGIRPRPAALLRTDKADHFLAVQLVVRRAGITNPKAVLDERGRLEVEVVEAGRGLQQCQAPLDHLPRQLGLRLDAAPDGPALFVVVLPPAPRFRVEALAGLGHGHQSVSWTPTILYVSFPRLRPARVSAASLAVMLFRLVIRMVLNTLSLL